ncbi:site-specific integrase [Carbonactinospora thermoautotrophica]|uniref:site-specific integrase n=1 Tax=Carbonactinospora thermoautotrophica TaxID=1469144 RepID=UPI003558A0FE
MIGACRPWVAPKDLGPFEHTAKISFVLSLQTEGRSPHTVTTYRRAVSLFAGWLLAQESGPRRWSDVTRDDLEAFFADLLRDHRPGTARTYVPLVSQRVLSMALRAGRHRPQPDAPGTTATGSVEDRTGADRR